MQLSGEADEIVRRVFAGLGPHIPKKLGIALSGGSDSTAVMVALAKGRAAHQVTVRAVTVDHGLRPDASEEAVLAGKQARALGLDHDILEWTGWDGRGNVQDQARAARYALLADWAQRNGLDAVVLGHTADDQAETVLMRLGRASGVDGLSGMSARRIVHNVTFLRPALGLRRTALRAFLTGQGIGWIDDPSNDNLRFERVRARGLMPDLEQVGVTVESLVDVAENMRDARAALDWYTFMAAREHARVAAGAVAIDQRAFRTLPTEIARRLLIGALRWVGGAGYPPRREALGRLLSAVRHGTAATTLHGCIVAGVRGTIWIAREAAAVSDHVTPSDAVWDRRWRIAGPGPVEVAEMRALGSEGLAQCPTWRDMGLPRHVLLSVPALWQGDRVLAAPLVGHRGETCFEIVGGTEEFFTTLLSH